MSRSYEDYEQEYESKLAGVRAFLASGTLSPTASSECELLLGDARRCIHAMQGLAEIAGDQIRLRTAKSRLQQEVNPLMREVTHQQGQWTTRGTNGALAASAESKKVRTELFGRQHEHDVESGDAGDTERLLSNSEQLLAESQRLCSNSEEIGGGVLLRMGSQREQLEMAGDHLEGTRNATGEARRILKQMGSQAVRSKMCLYAVIAILVIANGIVLYKIFTKK